ncbi:MAG: PD40 domain-containing protein [Anaerolineae bacterium]|nr:PD40 domain-containing protein [Anaerolineae bacterium]
MNKARFMLISVMILLSFAGRVVTAQERKTARDFLFIGIDPQTLNGGRNADIYLVRSDGSRIANLTSTPLDSENHAVWSADGKQIYFSRNSVAVYPGSTEEQSSTSFYVMDISKEGEKTDERLLFDVSDVVGQPMRVENWALSPDDSMIVFMPTNDTLGGTYVIKVDGTNLFERLVKGVVNSSIRLQWSPDSTEFAYIDLDCTASITNLCPYWTTVPYKEIDTLVGSNLDLMKRWHPDEVFLGFDYPNFTIQQGNKVILHDNHFTPTLAPNGDVIAYTTHNDANTTSQLVTYNLDAGQPSRILTSEINGTISFVQWSPDSQKLAFVTTLTNGYEAVVYAVNTDGTGQVELLRREIFLDDTLAWRPDPTTKV